MPSWRSPGELFARASELAPEFPKLKAPAQFCQGRALILEGKHSEAASALREALRVDPDSAYAHNALGIALLRLGRHREAIAKFQDAVVRAPRWAYPHHNLALTYLEMRRLSEADRAYQSARRAYWDETGRCHRSGCGQRLPCECPAA